MGRGNVNNTMALGRYTYLLEAMTYILSEEYNAIAHDGRGTISKYDS